MVAYQVLSRTFNSNPMPCTGLAAELPAIKVSINFAEGCADTAQQLSDDVVEYEKKSA